MKKVFCILLLCSSILHAQDAKPSVLRTKKGSFYIYWGWNRSVYSNSDINFRGDNYNFTLHQVVATDRQTPFDAGIYFNPGLITIPQTNLRIAYFFKEKYELSLGVDHMKYVMVVDQLSTIDGVITNSGTSYDGIYVNQPFQVKPNFLLYEHTDGLNYINAEIRSYKKLLRFKKFRINHVEGVGAGFLMPKTNATLLNNLRHDDFHISGFGLAGVLGLNFEFFQRFFIQAEVKAGYINMPDIRTTHFEADRASQQFTFLQSNLVLGLNLNNRKVKSTSK